MNGATLILSMYAFMALTGATFIFNIYHFLKIFQSCPNLMLFMIDYFGTATEILINLKDSGDVVLSSVILSV